MSEDTSTMRGTKRALRRAKRAIEQIKAICDSTDVGEDERVTAGKVLEFARLLEFGLGIDLIRIRDRDKSKVKPVCPE